VLFRHEEKFHHPTGIGFIIEDTLPEAKLKQALSAIKTLSFERVGQKLDVDLIAIKQKASAEKFVTCVKSVLSNTCLGIILMSEDTAALKTAIAISKDRKPVIYSVTKENVSQIAPLAKEFGLTVVVGAPDLKGLSELTTTLVSQGMNDLILNIAEKSIKDRLWDLTQIRRQAIKKSNRLLGFPTLVTVENSDPYEEIIEAGTFIAKYASIVLVKGYEPWQGLSLLALRQNIYTDPQKPLQIEPKVYSVGQADNKSPVLVTTNFSLSYYTVLAEVEASKIPSYIVSIDTEGMSVLTAWAAEKFTAERVSNSIRKLGLADIVSHRNLIIPGYVAVMSGDLAEQSGWQIAVGPKEAAGIPSFLKNL